MLYNQRVMYYNKLYFIYFKEIKIYYGCSVIICIVGFGSLAIIGIHCRDSHSNFFVGIFFVHRDGFFFAQQNKAKKSCFY